MQIRIRIRMRVCNTGLKTLHGSRVSFHSSIVSIHSSRLSLRADQAFHFDANADPDAASRNDADPDP